MHVRMRSIMRRPGAGAVVIGSVGMAVFMAVLSAMQPLTAIAIDYPAEGSIFPPDMVAPTFLWRETNESATVWQIDVAFADGSAPMRAEAPGERLRIGQ